MSKPRTAQEAEEAAAVALLSSRRFIRPATGPARGPLSVVEGNRTAGLKRDKLYRRLLVGADAVALITTILTISSIEGGTSMKPTLLLLVPLLVLICKVSRMYERDEVVVRRGTLDEAPAIFQIATLVTLLAWLADEFFFQTPLGKGDVLALLTGLVVFMLLFRVAARRLASIRSDEERCLLIGDERDADRVRAKFAGDPSLNASLVACIPPAIYDRDGRSVYELTEREALAEIVSDLDIDRVIIAPWMTSESEEMLDVIRKVKAVGAKVSLLPRLFEVVGSSVQFDDVNGLTLLGVRRFGLTRSSALVKRALDVVVAGTTLVLLAPLFVVVSIAIVLDSGGPVFFRQVRVGRDGRQFHIVKFRTMIEDAEKLKDALLHRNEADGLFKIAEDPRITRVGRFLRGTSLDELPQLINVLRGDMSLVGPRPLVVEDDSRVAGWRRRRLAITPGMTGPWQILGSSRIPLEEMVTIDYLYVANWSLWADLKILMRTVPYMLARRGM